MPSTTVRKWLLVCWPGLQLIDAPPEEINEVYRFCEAVGLPTTLAAVGLAGCGRDRLLQVAQKACAPEECIHHEAGSITPDKVLNAMLAADAIGTRRKSV
jgi:Glycerol dehydrogenase and related enzymes